MANIGHGELMAMAHGVHRAGFEAGPICRYDYAGKSLAPGADAFIPPSTFTLLYAVKGDDGPPIYRRRLADLRLSKDDVIEADSMVNTVISQDDPGTLTPGLIASFSRNIVSARQEYLDDYCQELPYDAIALLGLIAVTPRYADGAAGSITAFSPLSFLSVLQEKFNPTSLRAPDIAALITDKDPVVMLALEKMYATFTEHSTAQISFEDYVETQIALFTKSEAVLRKREEQTGVSTAQAMAAATMVSLLGLPDDRTDPIIARRVLGK